MASRSDEADAVNCARAARCAVTGCGGAFSLFGRRWAARRSMLLWRGPIPVLHRPRRQRQHTTEPRQRCYAFTLRDGRAVADLIPRSRNGPTCVSSRPKARMGSRPGRATAGASCVHGLSADWPSGVMNARLDQRCRMRPIRMVGTHRVCATGRCGQTM